MAYRYTNTDKWQDAWFLNLNPIEKLLFNYLCDNCDTAGFIEVSPRIWAAFLGADLSTTEAALRGLGRGLTYSELGDCIYLNNFLKHQKNLPLSETNNAHLGIIKRFKVYAAKFKITDINTFVENAMSENIEPLPTPSVGGYGNGNGNGKENKKGVEQNWKTDFEIYISELEAAYNLLIKDEKFIKQQEELNPNLDIALSMKKGMINFWGTAAGWKNKKKSKTIDIDWKATFAKTLDINKVYKQRKQQTTETTQVNDYWNGSK